MHHLGLANHLGNRVVGRRVSSENLDPAHNRDRVVVGHHEGYQVLGNRVVGRQKCLCPAFPAQVFQMVLKACHDGHVVHHQDTGTIHRPS